ncbi:IPP transferase-domain-containing protein, partial [Globomyces pollinis-pini]
GVGKSALAVQIAKQFKGHIINADSMQVYKGLDIITNKPDKKERESAPHHLFDFVHPLNEYSVADYVNDATAIIDKLHSQNILPVICGGTNHYTLSLLCNVNVFETPQESNENGHPSIDLELRKELQYLLDKIDPKIAKRWHENDFRKIRRSLEVYYYTGKRYSELLEDNEQLKDSYEGLRYRVCVFWLYGRPEELYPRLDARVDKMINDGMFTEMHDLREQMNENKTVSFDSQYNRGIFQSIAIESKLDKIEIEKLLENGIENMKVATRQYARHQVSQIKNKFVPVMIKEHNQNTGSFYLIDATDKNAIDDSKLNSIYELTDMFLKSETNRASNSLSVTLDELNLLDHGKVPITRQWDKFECDICTVYSTGKKKVMHGEYEWNIHLQSKQHKKTLENQDQKVNKSKRFKSGSTHIDEIENKSEHND